MTSPTAAPAITHFESRQQFTIKASRETVWKALVNDTDTWWPSDFYFTGEGATFTIEAKAGGRVYEKNAQGAELLWGTVLAIVPNEAMNWCAPFSPPYAGPGTSYVHIALEDSDDGATTFTLSQHYIGTPSEGHKEQMEAGWDLLFNQALKAHVEG